MSNELLDLIKAQPTAYAKHLGINVISATRDEIVGEPTVVKEICTVPDTLHGGAIMSFADQLGAIATVVNLEPGTFTTTIESKTNFLSTIPVGQKAMGQCTPLHRGRRTIVWQTKVTREDGRLCAIVTQTQMVLEPKTPA